MLGYHHGHGHGYYGTCDGGGYGIGHSWTNQVPVLPLLPPTRPEEPATKTPDSNEQKKEEPKDEKKPEDKKPDNKEPDPVDPKEKAQSPRGNSSARVVVELPTDARLFIDDHLTKSTEPVRSFRTPTLASGETYYYNLRAELVVDGKVFTQTRRIVIQAGQEVVERFEDPRTVKKDPLLPVAASQSLPNR